MNAMHTHSMGGEQLGQPAPVPIIEATPGVNYLAGQHTVSSEQLRFSNGPVQAEIRVMQPDGSEAAVVVPVPAGTKIMQPDPSKSAYVTWSGTPKQYDALRRTPRAVRRREAAAAAESRERLQDTPQVAEGWLKQRMRKLGSLLMHRSVANPGLHERASETTARPTTMYAAHTATQSATYPTYSASAKVHAPAGSTFGKATPKYDSKIGTAFGYRRSGAAPTEAPVYAGAGGVAAAFGRAAANARATRPTPQAEQPAPRTEHPHASQELATPVSLSELVNAELANYGTTLSAAIRGDNLALVAWVFTDIEARIREGARQGDPTAALLLGRLDDFAAQLKPATGGQDVRHIPIFEVDGQFQFAS